MKRYVRFKYEDEIKFGLLVDNYIQILDGHNYTKFTTTNEIISVKSVELMIPCTPEKIICIGLNYYDTILEDGAAFPVNPLIFIKPPSTMVLSGENIIKSQMVKVLVCEAELGVVISKKAKNVSIEEASNYVWGYIVANDVTAKDLQKEDIQWTRAKSFDTFLPIGSEIVSGIDPNNLRIRTLVNGRLVQSGKTKDMIFNIDYLISFISHIMTLNEGDIIITGTPGGYGKVIKDGDSVSIEIEDIGSVVNRVKDVNIDCSFNKLR